MIAAVVLLWLLGSERGVLGALVGGFIGTVAAAGLVDATRHGELARLHTPVGLVTDLLPLAAVVLVLAFVGSYGAFAAALAWTVGSVAAAFAAPQTGQAVYLAPLAFNALAAAAIVCIAARQIGRGQEANWQGPWASHPSGEPSSGFWNSPARYASTSRRCSRKTSSIS